MVLERKVEFFDNGIRNAMLSQSNDRFQCMSQRFEMLDVLLIQLHD